MAYPAALERLLRELELLPGVGPRTAERLAYFLIARSPERPRALAQALEGLVDTVRPCRRCHSLTDQELCAICSDQGRDHSKVVVVEHPKDMEALERAGWRGLYHVLQGTIQIPGSPASDPSGDSAGLQSLRQRLKEGKIQEVVLGTNPDLEGDGTALSVQSMIEKELPAEARKRLQVTRLARGLPTGTSLVYANPAVIAEAIEERKDLRRGGQADEA